MKKLMIALAACAAALVASAATLTVTSNADTFPEATAGSLRAILAQASDGDTITFDSSLSGQTITIVGVNTAKADTSLVVDKAITIEGPAGGIRIDGGASSSSENAGTRIFLVSAGIDGTVVFRNLELTHGYAHSWGSSYGNFPACGGAIGAYSPVKVEKCHIHDCYSRSEPPSGFVGWGPALYSEVSAIVTDSVIEDCTHISGSYSYGGAVLIKSGSLTMKNVAVRRCSSTSWGGGFLNAAAAASLLLEDCQIEECSGNNDGGAIRIAKIGDDVGANVDRIFKRCAFRGCFATSKDGGAIWCGDAQGRCIFDGCEFDDCNANWGGAIRLNGPMGIFINCTFRECVAYEWGPVVDIRNGAQVVNCTFAGNFGTKNAGDTSAALFCCGGTVNILNSVGAYNYYNACNNPSVNDDAHQYGGTRIFHNSVMNAAVWGNNTSIRAFDSATEPIFAGGMVSLDTVRVQNNPQTLASSCVIPDWDSGSLSPDTTRVIAPLAGSILDGTGYPVNVNDDYTYIEYSADGGTTWTELYDKNGNLTHETADAQLITADQRGMPYNGKPPIGAAIALDPEASVYATGAQMFVDGDDVVFVWNDPSRVGTLTLANSVTADYLLVGGGGAGGFCRGGGGGGGGVISGTEQRLGVGTYTITVGTGGVPDAWTKDTRPNQASENCYQQAGSSATTCGGSSILTLNDATLLEAFGGGGGGNYLEGGGSGNSNGFTGGSGGGSTGKNNTYVAAGTLGQGSNGGANLIGNKGDAAAGGGGAGGAGGSVTVDKVAGAGGVGVASSISGQEVYYGGGGGGGVYTGTAGAGGLGGGGHGGWGDGSSNGSNNDMTAGADGLGGGGGGASGSANKWPNCGGAKGGSGTVIIRMPLSAIFAPVVPEPVDPAIESVGATVGATEVTVGVTNVVKGTDSTGATRAENYSVYYAYAVTGETPAETNLALSAQSADTVEFTFEKPAPSTESATDYTVSVYVVNDQNVTSVVQTCTFTIPKFELVLDPDGAVYATGVELQLDGNDVLFIWTNMNAVGTLVLVNSVTADYLLVGGGGAGGFCRGGGGGGGGVLSGTGATLTPGTYMITVGAGGTPDTWEKPSGAGNNVYQFHGSTTEGANGGASTLKCGGETVYTAPGGGGGGTFITSQDSSVAEYGSSGSGQSGASAGGSANQAASVAGIAGLGNAGGAGFASSGDSSGGGGGAGSAGLAASAKDISGNGGAGVVCSITGSDVTYGGGGGAGVYSGTAGVGGVGGGGNGGNQGSGNRNEGMTAGVDGLGGGGGGASGAGNRWDCTGGAPGGSGVVIIRMPLSAVLAPVKPGPRLGWTARPADARGWNFSEYGWQVFAFRQDRGDPGSVCVSYSQNVPLALINNLTDTITQHHQNNWEAFSQNGWSGVYNDGRQPADFFAVSPSMGRGSNFGKEDAPTLNYDSDDCFPGVLNTGFDGDLPTDGKATFTFKRLVPGHMYIAEIFVHNSNSSGKSVTAPDGVTVAYYGGTVETENDWKYGGFLTGCFIAEDVTQDFTFTFAGVYQINAVQLRDVTEAEMISQGWWSAYQNTADAMTTIATTGTLKYAYAAKGTYTANGVEFVKNSMLTEHTDNITVSPAFVSDKDNYNSRSHIAVADSGYQSIINQGWCGTSGYAYQYTFKGLTPGKRYLAQFIIFNSNDMKFEPRIVTGPVHSPFVRYGSDTVSDGEPWYYGGNLVNEFIAEGTEHTSTLNFFGTARNFSCLNAVQLRELPGDPIAPVLPSIESVGATVGDTEVTIGVTNVVKGTDSIGMAAATSYDVYVAYAVTGSTLPTATRTLSAQTAENCEFSFVKPVASTVSATEFTYNVYVRNNKGVSSVAQAGTFTIPPSPLRPVSEYVAELTPEDGWIGVPLTGAATDFVTTGICVTATLASQSSAATSGGSGDGSVVGIPFVESKGIVSWGDNGWYASTPSYAHFCRAGQDADSDYALLLSGARTCSNPRTLSVGSLKVGATYVIQIFIHNGRYNGMEAGEDGTDSACSKDEYLWTAGIDGATVQYGGKTAGDVWYHGGTLIKMFTASATTYDVTLSFANGASVDNVEPIINGYQVREIPTVIAPTIGGTQVAVEGQTATITLTGVTLGTGSDGIDATSYDVYVAVDGGDAQKLLSGQTAASVAVSVPGLALGNHTYSVTIENNGGCVSPAVGGAITITELDPAYYFPDGNWEAKQMTRNFTEIETKGTAVFAFATGAGGDRLLKVNGVDYYECYPTSGRTYCLTDYVGLEPYFNSNQNQNDGFNSEDWSPTDTTGQPIGTLLRRAWYYSNSSGTGTLMMTLKNLEPGAKYVVQLTIHNHSDDSEKGHRDGTMTAPDGVTMQYGPLTDDTDDPNRYGGTLIGTFIASNTTHEFTMTYTPAKWYQLNSIQLRKMTAAPAEPAGYPTIGGTSATVIRGAGSISVTGITAGIMDGTCDVYYTIAEAGESFGEPQLVAEGVTGSCVIPISGLESGKTYNYSVFAVNGAKLASAKAIGSIKINANPGIPEEMTVEPLIRPGLVQAKFGGGVLFGSQIQPPLVSNLLSQTDYDGQLDYTYGALMANQNCADESAKVLNTYTATQWNWDKTNTVFAYEGEIYLQKDQKLVIFGRFDDGEAAVVDGVTLLAQGNSSGHNSDPAVRWVVYEAAETRWYPLNAWVWDWSSGKNCMTPPSALAYNLAGVTTYTDQNRDQWKHLEDTDGKGSFLRSKNPTVSLMTLGVPTTNGVDVTINAAFANLPSAAKFVAYVSTSHDGGDDPRGWDDVIEIANIASGSTAASDYTVKGLASYPFVRFAVEGEASISTAERCRNFRQMSCVVGFASDGLAVLVGSPDFAATSGTFDAIVASMGEVSSLKLEYEIATDSAFANVVASGTIADGITAPGSFPVNVTGLTQGTTYYIRVRPTADGVQQDWIVVNPVETEKVGTVRINEIMASNGDTFKTKKGRSGLDWIEIYNGTDEIVDLSGWYLYDDPTKAQSKWKQIQGTCVIPVHGYGIVWCDKDYTDWDAANEAWSEIGLSTSGETVFLAKPDGTVVDTVTFGTQIKDISYGVGKLQGSDEVTHVFFKIATPAAENGEYGYGPMTPTVSFSVPHGYKTEPVDVEITCEADPDADIYYTLDGSQPTTASTKYTEPIHITSTTILCAGVPQGNTVLQIDSSATYIYLNDVLSMDRVETGADVPAGFPASQSVNNHTMRYGMIQGVVNGEDRERILRGFTNTVATLSIVMDPELLFGAEDGIYVNSRKYMADGAAGERPMLLEQIDPVNGAANEFSVPGGLRLRGSSSLAESNPKHSLRFFFRGKYGMAKLNFPLFGDEGADEFSKVDLRCSQNYSWSMNNSEYDTFIHELFSRDSQRDLGQPYTRTRYYNLFINGQYWGLYMTQERGDKDFGETYLGGNEDYYDCIKTSSQDQWHYVTTVNDGTMAAWRNLQGLAYNGFVDDYIDNYNRALGLNPDGTRNEEYPILLNPENLMAYVTIAHFVCDADGPVSVGNGGLNNLYANRYQIDGGSSMDGFWFLRHDAEHSLGVKGEGAEFATWTQYDVDNTGLGTHEYNPLNESWSNGYRGDPPEKDNGSVGAFGPYELHAQLAKNPVYRRAFADYFYKHYLKEGGAMTPAVAKQRFEARMAEIDDVIVSEAARWSPNANQPKSRETWLNACSNCLDFIEKRTPYMKASYQARGWYPTLEPPTADVADGEGSIGQVVNFTAADGAEIYVTTDGSDPAESGTLSASATVPALPCTIKARAKLNDEWSPAQEVTLVAPKLTGDGLVITIAGDYTSTQELAPTGDVCRVILDDANVPGGLILKPGVAYTFEPAAETENVIGRIVGGDTSTFVLNGEGTLSMTGSDTLLTVNDLIVSNGTFAIKSTGVSAKKTPIVKVLGNLSQTGGTIDIDVSVDSTVQVYGIMLASKKMEAEFSGGDIVAKVGGQNKSAAIVTDKGSTDIVFKKECRITAELSGIDSRFAFSAGEIKFAKTLVGPVVVTMPQDLTGVSEAHVFKAEKTIEINGGTFDINVPAPGSEIFAASRPDEEADEDPGIIVIKGGTFELVAEDDCFNATDFIDVRAGLIYAVSLSDDVFDSNGGMDISGGTILAYATGAGHEAFDVEPEATPMTYPSTNEHVLAISGGTIFATGGKNSAWPTTITTAEGVNLFSLANADVSAYSGKYLTLNSSPKVTAKLPAFPASTGSVLATCPGFDGTNVSVGDTAPTSGSQNFHDLYIHGSSGFILIVR